MKRLLHIGLVAGIVLGSGSATLATASASASAGTLGTTVLPYVLPDLSSLHDLGPIAATEKLRVAVSMPGNLLAAKAAYVAMTTPGNPAFGRNYSMTEYDAAFGVSPAVSSGVQRSVEADGLTPIYVARDGSYAEFSGTAAQVEKTFKVGLDDYLLHGKVVFANTVGATVPSAVNAVLGLSNADNLTDAGDQDDCEPEVCIGPVNGPTLWSEYDEPDAYTTARGTVNPAGTTNSTDDFGQGQKLAIFGEGNLVPIVKDFRAAEDATTLLGDISKPTYPHIPIRETLVADDQKDDSDDLEWDLDSQSSTAMSPDLSELDFYFGEDFSFESLGGVYSSWLDDPNAPMTGNTSIGGCELLIAELGDEAAIDPLLMRAAMGGRTMFVSSGDLGSGGCYDSDISVNGVTQSALSTQYPAASPYVVGVGGTTDYTAASASRVQVQPATRSLEDGWDYSGGGNAYYEPQPADQAKLGGTEPVFTPCLGDDMRGTSGTGKTCRGVPDVSAISGDVETNGWATVVDGKDETIFGTSLASPLWAGMWARVRAAHTSTGCNAGAPAPLSTVPESKLADIGFGQQALYDVAESSTTDDAAAFFDVGGTTNSATTTNGAYTTLPRTPVVDPTGYDLVTGLGVPDLSNLIKILDCGTVPNSSAVPNSLADMIVTQAAPGGCPPNGTLTDPVGDEFPMDAALDITSVRITTESNGVVFAMTLAGLPESNPAFEDDYSWQFTFAGVVYQVEADNGNPALATAVPTFTLNTVTASSGALTSIGSLAGSFTNSDGVVSVGLPFATFNSDAKPTTTLTQGATLTSVTTFTETPTIQQLEESDEASFDNCPYVIALASGLPGTIAAPVTSPPTGSTPAASPTSAATSGAATGRSTRAPVSGRATIRATTRKKPSRPVATAPTHALAYTGSSPWLAWLALALAAVGVAGWRRLRPGFTHDAQY